MLNRLALALASSALLAGACVQPKDDAHPVANALPQADDVRIALPDTASARLPQLGELAEWYVATRGVTRSLNGGTAYVLVLVHTIVQFPPTKVDGATTTWGPHHDALDPAEWQLIVTEVADGTYSWRLEGRNRSSGGDFETLIDGTAKEGGTGDFTLDFDAAERVNPLENDGHGQITATYDIPARTLDLAVDAVEDREGTMTAIHYDYSYAEDRDGSGDMVFAIFGDTDDPGTRPEEMTIRSRWEATGAGRADVRLRGGDTTTEVLASECWDSRFLRVFYADSLNWRASEGDVAACAYADQDLP